MNETLNLMLPSELCEELEKIAIRNRQPKAVLVRSAVISYIRMITAMDDQEIGCQVHVLDASYNPLLIMSGDDLRWRWRNKITLSQKNFKEFR